jgi:hypothetical protein
VCVRVCLCAHMNGAQMYMYVHVYRCVCVHTFCLFVVLQSRAGVFACIPFATLSSYKHKQVCLYAHILNL